MKKAALTIIALFVMTISGKAQQLRMDTHLHVDVPMMTENMPGPDVDLRMAMDKAGMNAIGMTFAVDYVKLTHKGMAYERFLNALDGYDRILKANKMKPTLNGKQLKKKVIIRLLALSLP